MKKTLLAATRLAALYAAGVVVMVLVVSIFPNYRFRSLRDLLTTSPIVIGACFAIGFVLLAVARRVGFAILWLVQLAFWAFIVRVGIHPLVILVSFPGWTVFALPLYLMTAVGLGGQSTRAWLRLEIPVTLIVWLGMTAVALLTPRSAARGVSVPMEGLSLENLATYVCAALPFLIGGRELIRVVMAVRGPRPSSPQP